MTEGDGGGKDDDDGGRGMSGGEMDEGQVSLYLSATIYVTTTKNIVFAMLTLMSPVRYHGA